MFLFLFSSFVSAEIFSINQNYWTYQEFSELYKEKQNNSDGFSNKIRSKAEPISEMMDKPVQIAIIYPGKQASDYWRRSVSSFEARLIESKIPYEIRTYFSKPGAEIRLQVKQISEALKFKPDYLIFTLDALKHQVLIEQLISQKKPKVILQNITTPLKQWGETQPFLYVGFDHAEGTKLLAEAYRSNYKNQGKYAIFYGTKGYVSQMRGGTFKTLMSQQKNMQLVAEYYTGFNRKKAYSAAIQLLSSNSDIDFIFSSSTDIALGVVDAIKEMGKQSRVKTNGWGGGSSELEALIAGELDMTVMRLNDDNGVAMAEAILHDIQKKPVPTVYSGDMLLLTKTMPETKIKQLSKKAFRYSNEWISNINSLMHNRP